jgi:hypothetical protein
MLPNVADFLSQFPLGGTDAASLVEWRRGCEVAWEQLTRDFLTDEESIAATSIFHTILDAQTDFAHCVAAKQSKSTGRWSKDDRRKTLETLLNRPQIEQRTEAWYLDAAGLLSASQFNTILKSGRTRGQVVLQKASALPPDMSQRKTCVQTFDLNPFTWGIRFEPIVKMVYEDLRKSTVAEMGRLKHKRDPRLAASPDGLIVKGPDECLGRFVEFKAPVTRKILNTVPEDYMAQMQIQMEVGDVEECDYLEVKIQSAYGTKVGEVERDASAKYSGFVYLISRDGSLEHLRYEYSPLHSLDWQPPLKEGETLLESIYWKSNEWFLTTVGRSRSWFASVQPAIAQFWEDVEKAKRGEFQLPASTRKAKEPKPQALDDWAKSVEVDA